MASGDSLRHYAKKLRTKDAPDEVSEHSRDQEEEEEEEDQIMKKVTKSQDSSLWPLKVDLSQWIEKLTGEPVSAEGFMEALDSGTLLCRIAQEIEQAAKKMAEKGSITEPLPQVKLKFNKNAKSGSWFARDNCSGFLSWCSAYGMPEDSQFVSEDLVSHRNEKPVVNCVLWLARMAVKFGIEPPSLVRMEKEIEEEEAREEAVKQKVVPSPRPTSAKKSKATPDLHTEVMKMAARWNCQDYVKRVREGCYEICGKRLFIRLLHGKFLMVRVGGGWQPLEKYLQTHVPVQVYEYSHNAYPGQPNESDRFLVVKSKYKSSRDPKPAKPPVINDPQPPQ